MPAASSSRARPNKGDFANIKDVDSNSSRRASAASALSPAMYFQMSLRSRLAVAESRTLANASQLSSAAFFSGFGLQTLHVKIGYPARADVVQPELNVVPQAIKFERSAIVAIRQQAKRFAYDLAGRPVSAFANLALDESFQLRGKGDIHRRDDIGDNQE